MASFPKAELRKIPSIDELLRSDELSHAIQEYGRSNVLAAVQQSVEDVRQQFHEHGSIDLTGNPSGFLAGKVKDELAQLTTITPTRVFNLTGTVIHTNLGRAPLPEEAIAAMHLAARYPSNLEFDLRRGRRGDRDDHLEQLICRLTGAEAATVVNNNAAAVMLSLNTLALRRKVLVARGQLIEIGGSFRMPDIMKRAGAKLHEVGTTNRTHAHDYADAVDRATGLIMEVHTSNYLINGFTKAVPTCDLAKLAGEHAVPFMVDLGSGTLVKLEDFGLPNEATVADVVTAGADIVTFSGDKLLGGPQAGIIVGRADLIARIKRNPMKRAMRMDKLSIAALRAVLQLYLDPERVSAKVPVLAMLRRPVDDIQKQAVEVLPAVERALGRNGKAELVSCMSQVGSGALPTAEKTSAGIGVKTSAPLAKLSAAFRQLPVPVIGRLTGNRFVMDLRCLDDTQTFVDQLEMLTVPGRSAGQ